MDCSEYFLEKAIVFGNDNLKTDGRIVYAPIYMVMFLQETNSVPAYYKIDLNI